jgi:ubiquinone/menaquinone biosynthesis C-methylase UbiE
MCIVCPSWLSFILYNPIRKVFTDRDRVLRESGIANDSVVLEVGAGNGFFTEFLAERVKKVCAVELQDGMVRKLRKRVARFGDKVAILQCDIAACGIEDNGADVCLMYYSFHEVKDKAGAAGNISRALKAGGVLSIYEPFIEVNKREMRKTAEIFESSGFTKEAERDTLLTRFVRLRKSAA